MDTILSNSARQTLKTGKKFAKQLKAGDVICLHGELGAGKTQFVKGIASYFEINPLEVSSPTFTLIHEYSGTLPVYHFDFYRVKNEKEALEIGSEEYFYGEGVSIIEWPDNIKGLIPDYALHVYLTHAGEQKREIRIY